MKPSPRKRGPASGRASGRSVSGARRATAGARLKSASAAPRASAPRVNSRPIRRVLIANRGEIAVRVIRTLREMGITSIAVFSEPDRASLHVLLADEAYPIGPGPAGESYLHRDRVLAVARERKADAIHPGYGFFAENAAFARACEEAGVVFIGPGPDVIATLGDKLAAREAARKAGVPLVPGSESTLASLDELRAVARKIGFPIMLKAAAGGGGKGMRKVARESELEAAWALTRGEARAAFGDDRVDAERAIERPRHVEAQIMADAHGHVAVRVGEDRDRAHSHRPQRADHAHRDLAAVGDDHLGDAASGPGR